MAYMAKRSAWRSTMEAYLSLRQLMDATLRSECGLTMRQFEVLIRLWIAPGQQLRVGQLATQVYASHAEMAQRVTELEHDGLVMRLANGHEQGHLIEMSPHGKRRFADAERVQSDTIRDHYTNLITEPEARTLTRLNERVLEAAQATIAARPLT